MLDGRVASAWVRMFFYVLVVGVVGVVDVAKNDALYENVDNQFGVLSLL